MAGDHDDGCVDGFFAFFKCFQHFDTVHLGHFDVGEDKVIRLVLRHLETLFAVLRHFHFMPFVRQNLAQRIPDTAFVVND